MSNERPRHVAAMPGRKSLSSSLQAHYVQVLKALVGLAFDRLPGDLDSSLREQRVAKARQVGIYLAHTKLRFNMTQAGEAFNRDRTTASYACQKVEDARDDPAFDALVSACEQALETLPSLISQGAVSVEQKSNARNARRGRRLQ